MIVKISGVDSKEKASALVGKKASWKSPAGKEIKGTITGAHGGKGAVRASFETGMPGQSVGTKVAIH
jgi:large subunit ribosomal protein L35Ae